jgi:hypothetical protein
MPRSWSSRRTVSLALAAGLALLLATTSCRRSHHARVSGYTAPPVPAGFAETGGMGWRIAVPTTWKDQKTPATWSVSDPQAVDEFHANANVMTEPFTADSYEYARANEAALRKDHSATVETVREDVIDGDPTLIVESRWNPTPPSTVPFRTMQAFLSSRGTGSVVTCSVSSSAFERYRTTCESILHSFAVER